MPKAVGAFAEQGARLGIGRVDIVDAEQIEHDIVDALGVARIGADGPLQRTRPGRGEPQFMGIDFDVDRRDQLPAEQRSDLRQREIVVRIAVEDFGAAQIVARGAADTARIWSCC